jgi:hypothetical protein
MPAWPPLPRLCPLTLALAAVVLSAALPPSTAGAATPLAPGTYRARPAPVLACGGLVGDCRVLLLEGSLDLSLLGPPDPGVPAVPSIERSDLALRTFEGASGPFPSAGDLPLTALAGADAGSHFVFTSQDGASQTVRFELWPASDWTFLLRGTYDEGCCDRFRYEIGAALIDFTEAGPAADYEVMRLIDNTFRVAVDWRDHDGRGSGTGTPISLDDRSGHFWFFRPDNPELLVKVIDACDPFGRWWFFAAGLTDVEVEIRVKGPALFEDEKVYTSPAGTPFAPILDTEGFSCDQPVV